MKRKMVLSTILVVFFFSLIFGVIYLNNPELFCKSNVESVENSPQINVIKYPVLKGEIKHTYDINGQVISGNPELYVTEIVINNITDTNFKILKSKGDTVDANLPFYEYKGKEKSVDYNGLIIDIIYTKIDNIRSVNIQLLNYDKLYVATSIDAEKINYITYNTPVLLTINGNEYESSIMNIGYEITDKKLPVELALPEHFLPGTEVKITFTLDVQNAGLYVSEDAVFQDGEDYYANIENGTEMKQVKIKTGQRFSIEETGNIFNYIEILSGLTEDDILIVETVDTLGSDIKENLKNE